MYKYTTQHSCNKWLSTNKFLLGANVCRPVTNILKKSTLIMWYFAKNLLETIL